MSESTENSSMPPEDRDRLSAKSDSHPDDTADTPIKLPKYPLVGQRLSDRYDVLRAIASGGMGTVYRARHVLMDKIVAVKVLNESYAREPSALARFKQEAKIACQMSHPNIVIVHDFGIADDNSFYLVMDYVEGETLADILDYTTNMPLERVINLSIQICDGLEHAHELGLIHRDLKPSNLMLVKTKSGADQLKILDFGLAKVLSEGKEQGLSQSGYLLGTGYYMSPEQCRGKKATVQSEIYSIGCVLYELLIGLPPFSGDNILETIQQHIDETPAPMSTRRPDLNLPPEVEAIVARAMAKDPEDRYQSAAELGRALRELASKLKGPESGVVQTVGGETRAKEVGEQSQKAPPANVTNSESMKVATALTAPIKIEKEASVSSEGTRGTTNSTSKTAPLGANKSSKPLAQWLAIAAGLCGTLYLTSMGLGVHKEPSSSDTHTTNKQSQTPPTSTSSPQSPPASPLSSIPASKGVPESTKSVPPAAGAAQNETPNKDTKSTSDAEDERIAHMAMVCHRNGQCDTAVALLKHAVEISKKVHGKNSSQTAARLTELANLYEALDKPEKAHPLMEEVLEIKAAQKDGTK